MLSEHRSRKMLLTVALNFGRICIYIHQQLYSAVGKYVNAEVN